MTDNPYDVLELEPSATADDVRRAYFRLVRANPPETHPEEFKRIRAAYETLRSPLRRMELALLNFDESVTALDPEVAAAAAGSGRLDLAALALAAELAQSDLARSAFPEDLTPPPESLEPARADGGAR